MDAETFLKLATNNDAWLRKSRGLRDSADVLWQAFEERTGAWLLATKRKDPNPDAIWEQAYARLVTSKMLYGLALETAFKARILRERPKEMVFKMAMDGSRSLNSVEMKQFGVAMGSGHDLVRLGEMAGVFRPEAVFEHESDLNALRAILEDLGDIIVWEGRYPVPLRSGEDRKVSPEIPSRVFGHYMRDWTDRVLDHFLR
jgi:hypothetical protein